MNPDRWCGISASSAGAVIGCPARLVLPAARETSEHAERGNVLHEFARVVTKNPEARAQALLEVPEEYRHTAAGMKVEAALEGLSIIGCERAYALDVMKREVRYIGENIGRDYSGVLLRNGQPPLGRYEVPFTIDVEAHADGVPVELDYKSGQSIGPVEKNWQRRICAAGLLFRYETAEAISRVAYIRDDGSIYPEGHAFNVLDAEDFCDELVKAIDAVHDAAEVFESGRMPTVYPSDDNCSYCPAMTSCPYYTNFAKAMLGNLQAIEKGPELGAMTEGDLFKVWEMLKTAEKIVDHQLKAIKAIAAEKPIGDDKYIVAPQMKSRSYFDESGARGLIVMLLGQQGVSQDEIEARLARLRGKTEYPEFRKKKRLPLT